MITNTFKVILILICASINCLAILPKDPTEYAAWEAKMLASIRAQANVPPEQAIPKLGSWVEQMSHERTPNWEKGDRPVFHAAQSALLAIPGHAEYYEKEIKD